MNKGNNKIFLPSSNDIELLPAKSRRRCFEGENQAKYWWLSNSTIVDKNGGIVSGCDKHDIYGIVPAIIVKIGI